MKRLGGWWALVAVACVLAACAQRAPSVLEQTSAGAPGDGPRVVLAPMNVAVALPPDLEDAVSIVENALIVELQRRGARVAVIYTPDALTLWQNSMLAVSPNPNNPADLRAVAVQFATTLARSQVFDALLLPSLALREARVSGRSVRWDGVQRRLGVRPGGATSSAADAPVFGGGEGVVVAGEWTGKITGLSLHLLSLMPGKWRVQERWGGLDLVHDVVSAHGPGANPAAPDKRLRRELLADPENVEEGVALALDPIWRSISRAR
ncbi:MAG TPA: hypothetical protein VNF72_00255 [Myxococcota bacterium]|nr:hypothetical protein [Myxococcota bacterium]